MPEAIQPERRLYPSRSGERIDTYIAELSRPPEKLLDEAERADVLVFESDLSNGRYTVHDGRELRAHEERSLDVISDEAKYLETRHEITTDFFLTEDGKSLLANNGIEIEDSATTPEAMLAALRGVAASTDRKTLALLAKQSRAWATEQITAEIEGGVDAPDFTRAMLFDDTSKIRNTLQAFEAYRDFVLDIRQDMHDNQQRGTVAEAKRDITNLYLKVINGKLAEIYPDVLWAWDQANASGDEGEQRDLREVWPAGEVFASMRPDVRRSYILALDRLRNGTAYDDGEPTAINQELRDLFSGESADLHEAEVVLGGRFSPEEHERLAGITFDATAMQAFCKDILRELGQLSDEPDDTYYEGRQERAADGKWQVIIREKVSAMGAEDPEGVLEIPAKFKRSLTKVTAPVGVISGSAHEIMHIYQLNNARNNQGSLRIAKKIKGRSSLVQRESGAVLTEHEVQDELFGATRPDGPHYMKAMEVLEAGGGEKNAIKAFYESYRSANPNESVKDAAEVAESRVMRLARRYGGYNSQPLNYAQTAAFVEAAERMTEDQRAMVFAEGAFDLPDMLTLHQYGLLSNGAEQFPVEQFCDIVERKLRVMLGTMNALGHAGLEAEQ